MTAAAIAGTFCTYRHVPSRGVVQLVIEIAVEHQATAFEALGYPEPGKSLHVAVARLQASQDEPAEREAGAVLGRARPGAPLSDREEVMPAAHIQGRIVDTPPSSQTLGAGAQGSSAASHSAAGSPVAPEGDENRGARTVKRACILCKDPEFQRFSGAIGSITDLHRIEGVAAEFIRTHCQIASRKELAHDERARAVFEALVTEFDMWRGRLPEIR